MSDSIPLSVPCIRGTEWQYVKECLDTEWVSSAGRFVEQFEAGIAAFTGAAYAVACVNGTAALHVALRIAGVRPGDEVVVPTITFIAPVNAVHYLSAQPSFQDADGFYNIDAAKLREFLTTQTVRTADGTVNKHTGRRVAAVVPVHVFGNACWLDDVVPLCRDLGIAVVEDATEAVGTVYREGRFAGRHAGTVGDLGCLSFNGNKIITTGGGGMILTNNPDYAARARYLTTQAKDDEVRYIHHEVGYNFRLTNLQAAVGVAQLERLPEFLRTKRANYARYAEGLRLGGTPDYADNNHWMYALQIDAPVFGRDRESVMHELDGRGIQTRPVWYLNHRQRPYERCFAYRVEQADALWRQTLNVPCSSGLAATQVDTVVTTLRSLRALGATVAGA